jgi:hypothetical protein
MYYLIQNGQIASGPHAVDSPTVRRLTSCGNPELLGPDLSAWGLVPEQRDTLGAGQGYGPAELLADGSAVLLPAVDLPPPGPAPVPASVTKRQLYRGLMQEGWLGSTMPQIDAAITQMVNAMTEPPREVARVEFFTSRDYLRNNPLLIGALMSPPLSKTVAEVDDFFRLCGSFSPEGE